MSPVLEQIAWWRANGITPWEAMAAMDLNPDPFDEPTWTEVRVIAEMKLRLLVQIANDRDPAHAELAPRLRKAIA